MKFDPIDPSAGTPAELAGAADLRRFAREKLTAQGSMRFGGRGFKVAMENLSEQGCQFWLPRQEGLPKGASIQLYIESIGPFAATVRWAREGWIGVEFELPVYPPVLNYIRGQFDRQV